MDNDYYTVKDIIFSLRPYYLDNEKKLQSLKEFCCSLDKNVSDYYFYTQKDGKKHNIYCKYLHDINSLIGLITYLNVKNNIYVYGKNISKVNVLDNGVCYFDDNYFKVNIKSDDIEEFYKKVNEIINSEFINKVGFEQFFDENNPGIHINSNEIIVECYYYDEIISLQYLPKKDKISIISMYDTAIYKDVVFDILNLRIPKEKLSKYIIELIEKQNKVFVNGLNDFNSIKQVDLNIIENDNQILLNKVKNKKKIRSYFV